MAEEGSGSKKHAPIIVKKHKKHHEEHHGGTWKVAYADFVTAMMAFFLLMWLINTVSNDKLKGISEYFTPSIGIMGQNGTGLDGGSDPNSTKGVSSPIISSNEKKSENLENENAKSGAFSEDEYKKIVSVMNNLEQTLEGTSEVNKFQENIIIERTPEGIKISIMDSINRSVFRPGSTTIQPYMTKFLDVIANLIKTVPNYISIDGHTSEFADQTLQGVDQWNLSIDRSNAIRKFFDPRIKKDQIIRVSGRANTEPFDSKDLSNPKNIRIVITLLNPDIVGKIQKAAPLN